MQMKKLTALVLCVAMILSFIPANLADLFVLDAGAADGEASTVATDYAETDVGKSFEFKESNAKPEGNIPTGSHWEGPVKSADATCGKIEHTHTSACNCQHKCGWACKLGCLHKILPHSGNLCSEKCAGYLKNGLDFNEHTHSEPACYTYTWTLKWDTHKVTWTWKAADGSAATKVEENVNYGTALTAPKVPETIVVGATTYTFKGWDSQDADNETDTDLKVTGNMDYTAVYSSETLYSVTFDTDGGSNVNAQKVEKDKTATKPENPTKAGFVFVKWVDANGNEFDFATKITADVALKAVWASDANNNGINDETETIKVIINENGEVKLTDGKGNVINATNVSAVYDSTSGKVTIVATPASGYYVDVTVNNGAVLTGSWKNTDIDSGWLSSDYRNVYTGSFAVVPGKSYEVTVVNTKFEWSLPKDAVIVSLNGYLFNGITSVPKAEILKAIYGENVNADLYDGAVDEGWGSITIKLETPFQYKVTLKATDKYPAVSDTIMVTASDNRTSATIENTYLNGSSFNTEEDFQSHFANNCIKVNGNVVDLEVLLNWNGKIEWTKNDDGTYTAVVTLNESKDWLESTATFSGLTWAVSKYAIEFKDWDESVILAAKNYPYGTLAGAIEVPADPTRTGYTFTGWNPVVSDVTETVTYVATYEINSYTVTWVVDGVENEVTYKFGATIEVPANPSKTGYTFTGWDKEIPTTMPAGDVTITATWQVNTYYITWVVDGDETTTGYDYNTIVTKENPVKEGWGFVGWFDENDNRVDLTNYVMTDEKDGIKLTAKFFQAAAMIGETPYQSFDKAMAAAKDGDTVLLLKDATIDKKYTIDGNITISGQFTITRADSYTGTLFEVKSGATLTLDGNLTIDGGNNYAFDKDAYIADVMSRERIAKEDCRKWFTLEEGAPIATAFMITTTGGTVNLNKVTIQNNYSVSSGVISAGANSTINLTGATIKNIACEQNSGVVANVSGANILVTINEGTVIDGNHVGGNHGLFKIYSGAKVVMNGGEITNTSGWNSNGVVAGIYGSTTVDGEMQRSSFIMNGGIICSNSSVNGPSNGRNAVIYGHSQHYFLMTGGTICHNIGGYAGVDAPHSNGVAQITGGAIVNNVSASGNPYPDVNGSTNLTISGGTFTQDVNKWCSEEFKAELLPDGTYGVREKKEFTVTFAGVGDVTVTEDDLVVAPEAIPSKDQAIFGGWDFDFTTPITGSITINAKWISDLNRNNVPDENETIEVIVDGKGSFEGLISIGGNKYVFDSTKSVVTLTATPSVVDGISASFVASIAGKTPTYGEGFVGTADITVVNGDVVEIRFVDVPVINGDKVVVDYNFFTKVIPYGDIYNSVIKTPAYKDGAVTYTYFARPAMKHTVSIDSLDLDSSIKTLLSTIGVKDFSFDMEELWLPLDAQIEDSVDLETAVSTYLTKDRISGLLDIYNAAHDKAYDDYIAANGDSFLDKIAAEAAGIAAGGAAAYADIQAIYEVVYASAMYYGAHNFGYNATGADTVDELIRIEYADESMKWAAEATVTLKDPREAAFISGSDLTLTYRDYIDEDLLAMFGLVDANGNVIDGAVYSIQLSDPYTFEGKNVSETAYELTIKFAGNENYKAAEKTFNIIISKATASIDLPNLNVIHGQKYEIFSDIVLGNKYGDNQELIDSLVQIIIGLDISELTLTEDGKLEGLGTRIQIILPEDDTLATIFKTLGLDVYGEEGETLSLGELQGYLDQIGGLLGGFDSGNETVDGITNILESVTGLVDLSNVEITFGGQYPTDIGVYLYGAVSTSGNYETAYDIGYIFINPEMTKVHLDWNTTIPNAVLNLAMMYTLDLGATAFDDELFENVNADATKLVVSLFMGIDVNGKTYLTVDPKELNNGAYLEIAFVYDFGNEMYYSVPIVRPVVVMPNFVDVELKDQHGNITNDMTVDFNNDGQGFDVFVNGEDVTDSPWTTVYYIGIQSNGQFYHSTKRPVHVGIYTAIAVYAKYNSEDGALTIMNIEDIIKGIIDGVNVEDIDIEKIVATILSDLNGMENIGLNAGVVTILPVESNVTVTDKIETVMPGTPHDPKDQVTAGSTVNGLKPDTTIITAGIGSNGTFSENGWSAINGTVNVDFPAWIDELLAKYAPSVIDGITIGDLQTRLLDKLPEILSVLEAEGATSEVLNALTNALENVVKALEKMPADIVLSFSDDITYTNVGAYVIIAVVTDSDHYPSIDAGLLVITPDVTHVELKWNHEDDNNVWTRELLKYFNLYASAYGQNGQVDQTATGLIKHQFITIDENGELMIYTNPENIPNGAYIEVAYIEFELDGHMYISNLIARPMLIIPSGANVEFVDGNGNVNNDRYFEFDNEQHSMDVQITVNGNVVVPAAGEVTFYYIGLQTNGLAYNSTEAPKHAGVYTVVAVYISRDAEGYMTAFGTATGIMAIEPTDSSVEVDDNIVVVNPGSSVDLGDMVHPESAVNGLIPDTTIITALLNTNGTFSENGWAAVQGNVNVDFPKWVDTLLAQYAPELVSSMTVAEFAVFVKDNLPALLNAMAEAGLSDKITSALESSVVKVADILAKIPDNVSLTFVDVSSVNAENVGVYLIAAVVTDSDHYPSADYGFLVVTPDVENVYLKWNYEDENNIWTQALLRVKDLYASAFDDKAYTELNANATQKITHQFITIDENGDLVILTDATKLDNGVYIEVAYIEFELDGKIYISDMIARILVVAPNTADVEFVDKNGNANDDQIFEFDNNEHSMDVQVTVNGKPVDVDSYELTYYYVGIQTNGQVYKSTVAPKHAGIYTVAVTYVGKDANGVVIYVGAAVGIMAIELTDSTIDVTGGNVKFDGEEHGVTVTPGSTVNGLLPDFTLISGTAGLKGNISEIGFGALYGNVNIDFPKWLDAILSETEAFNEGVSPAYLIDFITSYRDDLIDLIPAEILLAAGMTEDKLNTIVDKINAYVDQLLTVLDKLPADVTLTFEDDIKYVHPGYYFYCGIVTDSDHYPSIDTGLRVIEKLDMEFDMENTTLPYDGEVKFPNVNNPLYTDFIALITNDKYNTANLLVDADMLYVIDLIERVLGKEIPTSVSVSDVYEKVNVSELTAAIEKILAKLESYDEIHGTALEMINWLQAQLATLPTTGTITLNGELPVNVGEYKIYAFTFSELYKSVVDGAVLTIAPIYVVVDDIENTKIYGETDPELTANVTYYSYMTVGGEVVKVAVTELPDDIQLAYYVTRAEGENVGEYAMSVENATIIDSDNYVLEVVEDDTLFTITPAEVTITVNNQNKVYGDLDPALTYDWFVTSGNVNAEELGIVIVRTAGEDVGTYTITATYNVSGNYVVTVVDGELTITKAKITVTMNDLSKFYGDEDPTFTYTYATDFEGEFMLVVPQTRVEGENVGTYKIKPEAYVFLNDNFDVEVIAGTLTINPAEITIVVNNANKTFGENDPANEAIVTVINGTVNLIVTLDREAGENVGVYNYFVSYTNSNNYVVTETIGALTINEKTVWDATLDGELTYNGSEQTQAVIVTDGNKTLIENVDYVITDHKQTNAGSYFLTIEGIGNYSGTKTLAWTIAKKSITEADVALDGKLTYNGSEQMQNVTLLNGITADISYNTATNAGTYTLTVTGNGNYTGSVNVEWTIARKEITVADTGLNGTLVYNGVAQKHNVILLNGITATISGETPRTNAGVYTVTVTGYGNYTGSVDVEWTIAPKAITADDFILGTNLIYNGETQNHNVGLKYTDMTVDFSGDTTGKNAGEYTLTIKGTGNYSGTVEVKWSIGKKNVTITVDDKNMVAGNALPEFTATVSGLVGSDVLEYTLGTTTDGKTAGVFDITATYTANSNYDVTVINSKLTVLDCVLTVDGVAYNSWADAVKYLDANVAHKIVLYADINESDVAAVFYAWKNNTGSTEITIDLNGYAFYAKSIVAKSGMTVIIGNEKGGSFKLKGTILGDAGNTFVIAEGIKFDATIQMNNTKNNPGTIILGEEVFIGKNGIFSIDQEYTAYLHIGVDYPEMNITLSVGQLTLNKDYTIDANQTFAVGAGGVITIPAGVTLTLASKATLEFLSNNNGTGIIVGEGTIKVATLEHLDIVLNKTEIKNIAIAEGIVIDNYTLDRADVNYTGAVNLINTNVVITAGTFDYNVIAKCAAGYATNDNGNGTWTVVKAIAQVGNKYYASIQDAVNAAQDGDIIYVIQDHEIVWNGKTVIDGSMAAMVVVTNKTVTIDLNGYDLTVDANKMNGTKLYAVFAADENGHLTLKDSIGGGSVTAIGKAFADSDTTAYCFMMAYEPGTSLTVESGEYTMESAHDSLIYSGGDDIVIVNDGTFTLGNVGTGTNGKPWIFNCLGGNANNVIVNGGTFNADINHQFWANEVYVSETKALKANSDGTWTVVDAVAYVEEKATSTGSTIRKVGYATIQDAVDAAQNGDIIYVIKDHEIVWNGKTVIDGSMAAMVVVANKTVTIDLNGHDLTVDANKMTRDLYAVFAADENGHLTLKDSIGGGSVTATGVAYAKSGTTAYCLMMAYEPGTSLTVESGEYTMESAHDSLIYAGGDDIVTVNGGTFTLGNVGTGTNGKPWIFNCLGGNANNVIVNGGTFNADINHQFWANEVYVSETKALKANGDGTWTIVEAVVYVEEKATSTGSTPRKIGYASIQEAINLAPNGSTIVVLKSHEINGSMTTTTKNFGYETLLVIDGKTVTIDFNGYTVEVTPNTPNANGGIKGVLESVIFIENGGSLTLKGEGGITVNKGTDLYSLIYNCGSTLVIENGNYYVVETIVAGSIIYADNNHSTKVKGGNFYLGNVNTDASTTKPWIFNTEGKNESFIIVTGGTYNSNILMNEGTQKDCEADVPYGYICVAISNNTWTVREGYWVAELNGVKYEYLQDAINNATAGATITLIDNVMENVTITKSLTINGDNFKYTGTMTANSGLTVTVKNVNFVNGGFAKTVKSTAGTYTFTDCTFDGEGAYNYALYFKGANKVTIENCTVENYLYGFLYVPNAATNIFVKGVTVDSCSSYAVYFRSGVVNATFENFTVKNCGTGFLLDNTANRAFTIKNCTMENVETAIGYGNGTNTITCTAFGANNFGTASISEYAKVVLAEETATLKAPANEKVLSGVEGYVVKYVDGTYKLIKAVAQNMTTGVIYGSLAEAIANASAGDTIKLLTNVTEDVTVNKNLTIDGEEKNYTGNISVKGNNVAVTIKNINFVNGTGYAVTTNTIKSITIENCTVTNYGFGFLYANKTTPTVVVKNVTVNNCNYGFHYVYGSNATLENVTMTNVTYGLYIQNYADKTITLKNCDITTIEIWERTNKDTGVPYTGVQTFKFEGANTVGTLDDSQYAKYVLATTDATLTAPEGKTVTTSVADHKVVYENGVYKVIPCVYVAQIGVNGPKFESIQDAVNAAQDGDIVYLIKDLDLGIEDTTVVLNKYRAFVSVIGKDITFDMNGHSMTVLGIEQNGTIIFYSEGGKLTVKDNTGDGLVQTQGSGLYWMFFNDGEMVIASGNYVFEGNPECDMFYADQNGMTITGGNFTQVNGDWMFNATGNGKYVITVTGGTFNRYFVGGKAYNENPWGEVYVPVEYALAANGDGTWTITNSVAYIEKDIGNVTAKIGYATFAEAYAAAEEGETITLLKDVKIELDITKNVTVLKNEYNVTVTVADGVKFYAGSYDWDVNDYCPDTHYARNNGDGTWTVVEKFGFYGSQAILDTDFRFDFLFAMDNFEGVDITNYYAVIVRTYSAKKDGSVKPDDIVTVPVTEWKGYMANGTKCFMISYDGIAAKEMADELYVTIYNADGVAISVTREDSLKAYAERGISKTTVESQKTMFIDMLNYGAAAQDYFGYGLDDLANANLTAEQKALSADETPEMENSLVADKKNYYVGSNMKLESSQTFMFIFRQNAIDVSNVYAVITYTYHTGAQKEITIQGSEFVPNGNTYVVNLEGLVIADGRQEVTCTLYNATDDSVITTVVDSIESYCARGYAATNHEMFMRLVKFGDSAYAYLHRNDK